MKLVIIESPYKGKIHRNKIYARRCMLDSLSRGEAPFLSHLLYTQVLDDNDREQRNQGISAGLAWGEKAESTAVYIDYDISAGMRFGIQTAQKDKRRVEFREIGKNPTLFKRVWEWLKRAWDWIKGRLRG
jgi:hypothetical protein